MSILKSDTYINDLKITVENTKILCKLNNKSIFITGATGLIGSGLVDLLLMASLMKEYKIRIIIGTRNISKARKRFEDFPDKSVLSMVSYIEYDATKNNDLDFNVDYIIHAASNAHPMAFIENPVETMLGNVDGLKELLNCAKKNNILNIVYVSSSEVYGKKNNDLPFKENEYGYLDILNYRSAYASSKRASETLCTCYYKQYGVKFNIVRPGHIYGPTALKSDSRVGSAFAYCAVDGKDIVLKSRGNQIRSYCYVLDCATAIFTVLIRGEVATAYNISNSNSIISIRELAELYAAESGVDIKFDLPTEVEESVFNPMQNSSLDSQKIEKIGWKGIFDAKTGTSHTIAILKEK